MDEYNIPSRNCLTCVESLSVEFDVSKGNYEEIY